MPKLFKLLFLTCVLACPASAQMNQEDSFGQEEAAGVEVVEPQNLMVTVNVVDIVLNDEHRSGVDWGAIVADYHTIPLKKVDNPIWLDKKFRLSVGVVSAEDYAVLLDALDTVGALTQHSQAPSTLTFNKSETIDISEERLKVQVTLSQAKENAINVEVVPYLGLAVYDTKSSGKPPAMVNFKAQADLSMTPGSTIVIGSIFQEHEITKTHKFPLLGDLPLVGLVFRSHGRLMQKSEKIIFLSIEKQKS